MDRRKVLSTGAVTGLAALAGCASGSSPAAGGSRTVFSVAQPMLPIAGSSEMFPVRRIYCIGRNYAAHAREMGSDPNREPPFFFQKPSDAIQFVAIGTTADHPYPPLTKNYHYEIELVAALDKGGKNVSVDQALSLVYGYTIGLDMTRRDLQRAMGDEKKPWEIGKSFDHSAPMGPLHRVADVGHFTKGAITLKVNGVVKQSADLNMMTWSVAEQISKLSQAFELMPGDIIYSGTPENVGPVVPGDVMQGSIAGLPTLDVRVV
jgi:fumarylpyruvate hydrolase